MRPRSRKVEEAVEDDVAIAGPDVPGLTPFDFCTDEAAL